MFAQAIGEYGALGSFGAALQSAAYSVSVFAASISPVTWVLLVVGLIVVVIVLRR